MGFEMNMGERGLGLIGDWVAARKNKKAIAAANKKNQDFLSKLDYEPTYASDLAPTYQKTQSPLARSYLESILVGNNPAMTAPGQANARVAQARQQQQANRMWGTPQQLVGRERAIEAAQPWKVNAPTQPVKQSDRPENYRPGAETALLGNPTPEQFNDWRTRFWGGDQARMKADLQAGRLPPALLAELHARQVRGG